MLRSKSEVDRHVKEMFGKIKCDNETNRKLKGLNVARLYYNIKEYESARRYISEFLSIRPRSPEAHKILGQIYEGLNANEKAISSYKTSYEIADSQKDLLIRICELYQDVDDDISIKLHWVEEAEKQFPHNEVIATVRQSLIVNSGGKSREELEKLYLDEIKINPLNVNLHLVLLKFYLDWGLEKPSKVIDAYNYVLQVETRNPFENSFDWYDRVLAVLEAYEEFKNPKHDKEFEEFYLHSLERLVDLSLFDVMNGKFNPMCTSSQAVKALQKFDARLDSVNKRCIDQQYFQHMICQNYYHFARQMQNFGRQESVVHLQEYVAILLAHAIQDVEISPSVPFNESTRKQRCFRLSQCGHVFQNLVKANGGSLQFYDKLKEISSNKSSRNTIYATAVQQKRTVQHGYILNDTKFDKFTSTVVPREILLTHSKDMMNHWYKDLQHITWILIQHDFPSSFGESITMEVADLTLNAAVLKNKLSFSSMINIGTPESLCHLDVLAFVTATIFCARSNYENEFKDTKGKFSFLSSPVLCTVEQCTWWDAVIMLLENSSNRRLNKLRSILQKGLEGIRLLGPYPPPLMVIAHLAKVFSLLMAKLEKDSQYKTSVIEALGDRAEHYWTYLVHQCEKVSKPNRSMVSKNHLFTLKDCALTTKMSDSLVSEGRLFMAERLAHKGKRSEALLQFGQLPTPEASFKRALLYKELADELVEGIAFPLPSDTHDEYTKQLTKARDALYLTLDRLKAPGISSTHPLNCDLHPQLAIIEDAIETAASKKSEELLMGDDNENQSFQLTNLSNGHLTLPDPQISSTPFFKNGTSRLRQEVRPSPERLDAQVRHLMELQQNTMKVLEDQNAQMKAQNDTLMTFMDKLHCESKENLAFYRNLLQERSNTDTYSLFQNQITTLEDMMKDLQVDVRSIATEVSDLRALKLSEKDDIKLEEREAKVAIDLANSQAHVGLYGSYPVNFYPRPGYAPVSPAMIAGMQRPLLPQATLANHNYMQQGIKPEISLSSPVTPQVQASPQMISTVVSLPSSMSLPSRVPQPETGVTLPHAFPISMPQPIGAFSPVIHNVSKSTVFSPQDFLPDIPPPVYSAIRPIASPSTENSSVFANIKSDDSKKALNLSMNKSSASPKANVSLKSKGNDDAHKSSNDSKELVEDYEPNIEFKPVIELPDLVDTVTGEEDEEKLFGERCKLYRYDNKEWKERGIGEIRLLKSNTDGKVRLLMRRDQTYKICANHIIMSEMKITPMGETKNAYVWFANDYADEEMKVEQLAVKFKTAEIAVSFKEQFESAQKTYVGTSVGQKDKPEEKATPKPVVSESVKPSLSDMFKPAAGSWECNDCLVRNKPGTTQCCSCSSTKPGCSPAKKEAVKPSTFAGFSFGVTTTSTTPSFSFGVPKSTSSTSGVSPSFSFSISKSTSSTTSNVKSAPSFSFGLSKPMTSSSVPTSENKTENASIGFGVSKNTVSSLVSSSTPERSYSFGIPTTTSNTKSDLVEQKDPEVTAKVSDTANKSSAVNADKTSDANPTSTQPMFANKPTLGFDSLVPSESVFKTQVPDAFKKTESIFTTSKSEEADSTIEEYEPSIEFKPVIDLPDIVEVKTGEENENMLFKSRCKLYRFDLDLKEWKERGIGDIQILRSEENKHTRILMRREQTHKICANHVITVGMKLTKLGTADNAWVWVANDFAEEQLKTEKLAAHFKTEGLANEFKTAFDDAVNFATNKAETSDVSTANVKVDNSGTQSQSTAPQKSSIPESATPKNSSVSLSDAPQKSSVSQSETPQKSSIPSMFGGSSTPIFGAKSQSMSATFSGQSPSAIFSNLSKNSSISSKPVLTNGETISFQSLQKDTANESIFKTKDESAFKPQNLFANLSNSASQNKEDSKDEVEEYEPQVDFKPVIDLPDIVEVKTGEEDQEVLFKERAKLYRYVPETQEWKERGLGNISILKDINNQRVRILMRREQTHKICANHFITPGMKIAPMETAEKAWVWVANDYSDGELKVEKLAIRLKTQELADSFKNKFEECEKTAIKADAAPEKPEHKETKSLAEIFKPAAGSWECSMCLVRNKESDSKCLSCNTSKDGSTPKESKTATETQSSFKFGISSTNVSSNETTPKNSLFGGTPQSTPKSIFGNATPKPSIFGNQSDNKLGSSTPSIFGGTPKSSSIVATSTPTFSFGTPASSATPSFMFGGAVTSNGTQNAKIWTPPVVEANKSSGFTFSAQNVQPSRSRDTSQCDSEGGMPLDEGDHITFEPVIPLPDKVEIITGEEDQTVLYQHRAKLFRMSSGEWKEAGIGDIKILQEKTGKVRLLMRREQVHKICLNHFLHSKMIFKNLDEKSISWGAEDYSDINNPKQEIFTVRFKTPEIASDFHDALSKAMATIGGKPVAFPRISTDSTNSDKIKITFEKRATEEQIKRARSLMLPDNFYLYEEEEGCPGCIGCYDEDDDDDYEDIDDDCSYIDEENYEQEFLGECYFFVQEKHEWSNLGHCSISVEYDGDLFCDHVIVRSDDMEVANHIIGISTTHLQNDSGNSVTWSTEDDLYLARKTFKASFDTVDELNEFKKAFQDGKNYAEHADYGD